MRDYHRAPVSTWDHSLSVADELVLWHLGSMASPVGAVRDARPQVVVLIAAAFHGQAARAGLNGPEIERLALAPVLDVLRGHGRAVAALRACPADGLGAGERGLLLGADDAAVASVRAAAQETVEHHLADAVGPVVTVADRAAAMASARRAGLLRAAGEALGHEE